MPIPAHWSHSQIDKIFSCGEAYRLEKIARAPRAPAWWFVSGSAFHTATEHYDRAAVEGDVWDEAKIIAAWDSQFAEEREKARALEPDESKWMRGGRATKAAPNKEDGEFLFEQGRIWVANYRTWRLENPHLEIYQLPDGNPAIEVSYTVLIAGKPVQGAVDRVFLDTRSGEPLVVDLKSGSSKPDSADQLGEYAVALDVLLDIKISYGAYYMAREGRLLEPAPLNFTLHDYEELVRGASLLRDNKVFIPRKSNRCKSCAVNRFCRAFGGAEAHVYEGVVS